MGNIKLKQKEKREPKENEKKKEPQKKGRITVVMRPGKNIRIPGKMEIPEKDFHLVTDFFDGEPMEEKPPVKPEEKKDENKRKPTEHTEGHGKEMEVKDVIPDTKKG